MHSSALGAALLIVFRSFSSATRWSSFTRARYSSMVLGLVPIGIPSNHLPELKLGPTYDTRAYDSIILSARSSPAGLRSACSAGRRPGPAPLVRAREHP